MLLRIPPSDEKKAIEAALAEAQGQVSGPSGAAAKLGIPPSTLDSKIRAFKINKHALGRPNRTIDPSSWLKPDSSQSELGRAKSLRKNPDSVP